MILLLNQKNDETKADYFWRLYNGRENGVYDLTYGELINLVFGLDLSADEARKRYYGMRMLSEIMDEAPNKTPISQEDLIQLRDERNALNNERRINARDKRFQEKLIEAVKSIPSISFLSADKDDDRNDDVSMRDISMRGMSMRDMVIQLSDWHYGIQVDNDYNTYNIDIAEERLRRFVEVFAKEEMKIKPKQIHVVFQGDLISGNIHNTLRLQNQEDLVDQISGVANLAIKTLLDISKNTYAPILAYFVSGNHDRVTPKKEDSLSGEDYVKLVRWIVESAFNCSPRIGFWEYNPNQVFFKVCGLNFAAVHGDKDKFDTLVGKLMTMHREPLDCILTAHNHHTHYQDVQKCRVISNGSLVGMDDYGERLRMVNYPSQNILTVDIDGTIQLHPVILEEKM